MNMSLFEANKAELDAIVNGWFAEKGILDSRHRVRVVCIFEELPLAVEVSVKAHQFIVVPKLPDDTDEKLATLLEDIRLPIPLSSGLYDFITLGQLMRQPLSNLYCGGIGPKRIERLAEFSKAIGIDFGSDLPIGPKEIKAILGSDVTRFFSYLGTRTLSYLSITCPRVRDVVEASRQVLQQALLGPMQITSEHEQWASERMTDMAKQLEAVGLSLK
jgi:hypothetical protein